MCTGSPQSQAFLANYYNLQMGLRPQKWGELDREREGGRETERDRERERE